MANATVGKQPGIHISRWYSGLNTNRAATNTPIRRILGGAIPLNDTLIDGSNVEITPANTLARRPGYPKYCSVSYSTDTPLALTGCILNGNLFTLLDTNLKVYSFTPSSLTSIFTKGTTAQTYFKQVGNMLFFSDGVENMKWSGIADLNTGALAAPTNNGLVAPIAAPTISNLNLYDTVGATQTTHAWIAGYTYINNTSAVQNFYLLAPTGEIQWAVIAKGTTLASSTTAPNWATQFGIFGGTTIDGQMLWTNCGTPGVWTALTTYTNAAYIPTHPLSAVSTTATMTPDATSTNFHWVVSPAFPNTSGITAGFANSAPLTGNTNILLITGLGFALPTNATITGIEVDVYRGANRVNAVSDVNVQLLKAGTPVGNNKATSGFWPQTLHNAYTVPPEDGVEQVYGGPGDLWGTTWAVTDINNTNFGVQLQAHQGSTATTSGGIVYVNGNPQTPVLVTIYYIGGAADIAGTVYAQIIVDSNNNYQRVGTGGTSGSSTPSWSTTIGGSTTDGSVTWNCLGTANQLPVQFGWSYGYAFHGNDFVTHVSTLSPLLTITAPVVGTNVTLNGFGSNDTQVDQVQLYRTVDGGSLLLYDTSTTNVNATTAWTMVDTAGDADLNFEIIGPVADANDPPPAGMTILAYWMGRLWGWVGTNLYFSAGPDCINGDGNQAWPPANVFPFASAGTGLAATSTGLLAFTANDVSAVLGGPQLTTFWVQPLMTNLGVLSQNCITQDGDTVYALTTHQQYFSISSNGLEETGFTIAPTIAANFPSATSYTAVHRSGADQGIFLSNNSTTTARYNLNAQCWDTLGTPTNGIGPIASVQTAVGTQTLLSTSNGFIVARSTTTFSDAGNAYPAYATVGSLTLSEPGQQAGPLENLVITSAAVGTPLTISVLPNEVSGSFTTLPNPVNDPWQLPASSSINMNRYDWKANQAALANLIKHVQIKITMPSTDTVKNEIYSLGLV